MWKVWQKWGSLWDTGVWCPVADPISLKIAGSQVEPLCRLLPSSWEGLLIAPQELSGDEDKACFYFCPCPKCCDFEVLGCNGEEKGEVSVSQPQLLYGSPVKGTFLSWSHWDVYRSLTRKKKVGRCFHIEIQTFSFWILCQGAGGLLILRLGQKSLSITGWHKLCIMFWRILLSEPFQTLCARSESAARRREAEGSHIECWTVIHCHMSQFGFGAVCHRAMLLM